MAAQHTAEIDFSDGRPPEVRGHYPHLMPEDRVIWARFVEHGVFLPELVWYDVRVGKAVEVASGQPAWMRKWAEYATRKRIDMVWSVGLDFWVVEAKPRAGLVALGQALYYAWAFEREYEHRGEVIAAVVTDRVDEDVAPVFELAGVWVFEVG